MSLLSSINKMRLGLQGKSPNTMKGALPSSLLHNEYSLNGKPNVALKPSPSGLDLNGRTPEQYLNNLPK